MPQASGYLISNLGNPHALAIGGVERGDIINDRLNVGAITMDSDGINLATKYKWRNWLRLGK